MDLVEVVRRRRMVRNYTDEPVDRATLERIVAMARRVPSAGFSQGQRLIVVTDETTRRRIAREADEDHYVSLGHPRWISTAPAHVVVCTSEALYRSRYREPDKLQADGSEIEWPVPYWYVDAGAVLMLLLLATVNEGLAAGFLGVQRLPHLGSLLGIPDEVTPIGVVTIGHAAKEQPAGSAARGWRPLDEVVRWERY